MAKKAPSLVKQWAVVKKKIYTSHQKSVFRAKGRARAAAAAYASKTLSKEVLGAKQAVVKSRVRSKMTPTGVMIAFLFDVGLKLRDFKVKAQSVTVALGNVTLKRKKYSANTPLMGLIPTKAFKYGPTYIERKGKDAYPLKETRVEQATGKKVPDAVMDQTEKTFIDRFLIEYGRAFDFYAKKNGLK